MTCDQGRWANACFITLSPFHPSAIRCIDNTKTIEIHVNVTYGHHVLRVKYNILLPLLTTDFGCRLGLCDTEDVSHAIGRLIDDSHQTKSINYFHSARTRCTGKELIIFPTMASAYSPEQIAAFLDYIGIPERYRQADGQELDLAFLSNLHTYTISAIPYENLSIHYNEDHTNNLDPQELFRKIVLDNRERGGYCMEVSILYNHVLRGLGFEVYTAGVKIRRRENGVPAGDFVGWVHLVNIVTLPDGTEWVCDVAFGGDGATKPMPLLEGPVLHNMGTQEIRLTRDHIPSQVSRKPETKMWIYQYHNSPAQAWNSFYAFYEAEFSEADFGVMNWFTGHSPESPQLGGVLVIKFLRRPKESREGEDEVFGKMMLVGDTIKENLGGKTKVVETFSSEDDRIDALKRWFNITLTERERKGIQGWRTELCSAG